MIKTSTPIPPLTFCLAFLLSLLPLMPVLAQGADTVYYNKDGEKLKAKTDPDADFFTVTTYTDTTQTVGLEKSFYIGGNKKSESQFTVDRSKAYKVRRYTGLHIGWHKNGQMAYKADYKEGKRKVPTPNGLRMAKSLTALITAPEKWKAKHLITTKTAK